MEIPRTKRFIPKGFELGTKLSEPIWCIVDFRAKLGLIINTILTLTGTRHICVNLGACCYVQAISKKRLQAYQITIRNRPFYQYGGHFDFYCFE